MRLDKVAFFLDSLDGLFPLEPLSNAEVQQAARLLRDEGSVRGLIRLMRT